MKRKNKNLFVVLSICTFISLVVANSASYTESLELWPDNCYAIWAPNPDAPDMSASVTETDWLRVDYGHSGIPGVRHIINTAAAGGVRTLWWRTNAGGSLMYPSQVAEATINESKDWSYALWDPFVYAVEYAHSLGMKVYAWYCPLEESHSFLDGHRSRFADIHPELSSFDIDGKPLNVPSFYYKEYRDYKLAITYELLTNWNLDGIVLDFERRGAPWRDNRYDYIPEIVDAFKEQTGNDPFQIPDNDTDWCRFRAQYVGKFIDSLKDQIENLNRPFGFKIMATKGNEATASIQLADFTKQRCDGLAMASFGSGWPWAGDPNTAFDNLTDIDVPRTYILYTYCDSPQSLREKAEAAKRLSMDICWFETTPLYSRNKYRVPSEMAMAQEITAVKTIALNSPAESVSGEIIGLCDWEFYINGTKTAQGEYAQKQQFMADLSANELTLKISAKRIPDSDYRGIAANIEIKCKDGSVVNVPTDKTWTVKTDVIDNDAAMLVGQPGAHPFVQKF